MKNAILVTVMMLAASVAQAKTNCSVSLNSLDNKQEYDRNVYDAEVTKGTYLIVDAARKSAYEVKLEEIDSLGKWNALNGKLLVTFSQLDSGGYGITVSQVDMSNLNDILPLVAIAGGGVETTKPVFLTVPKKGISLACYSY